MEFLGMFCLHTKFYMVHVIAIKRKVKFRFLADTTLSRSTFKGRVFSKFGTQNAVVLLSCPLWWYSTLVL
jgi:hypothetical protein